MGSRTRLLPLSAALLLACGPSQPAPESPSQGSGAVEPGSSEPGDEVTLSGTLVRMVAIGGESTGYGLQTEDAQIELDLATHNLTSAFQEGQVVTVSGHYETVAGVEIPERKVFRVTTIEPAGP